MQRLAASEDSGLKAVPGPLDIEEWRDGLISPRTLYNTFHAGYCSAYIQNPAYLLLIDFRGLEDWVVERVATAQAEHISLPRGCRHVLLGNSYSHPW